MKKLLFILMLAVTMSAAAFAQQKVVKNETKTKRTTTVGQKVHNIFSRHKHYSGRKTKHIRKTEKHVVVKQ